MQEVLSKIAPLKLLPTIEHIASSAFVKLASSKITSTKAVSCSNAPCKLANLKLVFTKIEKDKLVHFNGLMLLDWDLQSQVG